MSTILWDKPVNVNGRLVFGPAEALVILHTEMSERTDLHHKIACTMMTEALAGRLSPDEARELFEAVLAESDDLIGDETLPLAC